MSRHNDDRNDANEQFLNEAIEATRNEVPSEAEWQLAQRYFQEKLALAAGPRSPHRMSRYRRLRAFGVSIGAAVAVVALMLPILLSTTSPTPLHAETLSTPGELRIVSRDGQTVSVCPLRHTSVEANIAGFISRTIVTQQFENTSDRKIEAVYAFPLPQDAAVDHMVITIGDRRIVGNIKKREEARQVYEAAKAQGKVAGLLDQERPNVFTQSVANIEPGARVEVEISYVETLKFTDGEYEFMFPMVVAPRYTPPITTTETIAITEAGSTSTEPVKTVKPCTCPPSVRAGHDISIEVYLDAGMNLKELTSPFHKLNIDRDPPNRATISLANLKEIPNKDFVLRYRTASPKIEDALLVTENPKGRFFTLIVQPPERSALPGAIRPKEMIIVIDRSGSMSGNPIEKAKETMKLCIERMGPNDTFNLLSFSGGTGKCFPTPVPNSDDHRREAMDYLADLKGSGGTNMMPAIEEALGRPADPGRVRIVCFMTDGEIGNDFQIIDAVKRNVGTSRVFSFGIGNSVNRFLLDAMAREGRGAVEYVTLQESGQDAAERFYKRIGEPVLTDITMDWGNLEVDEIYPRLIPDLFSYQPIMIHGRLKGKPEGVVTLRGKTGSGDFERKIPVSPFPGDHPDGLTSLWARAKVSDIMGRDLAGIQFGTFKPEIRDEITTVGLDYRIMTQFTSFVAVDETRVTTGSSETVQVPTEMPEGQTVGDVDGDGDVDLFDSSARLNYSTTQLHRTGKPVQFYVSDGRPAKNEVLYATKSKKLTESPAAGTKITTYNQIGAFNYDPTNGTVSAGDVWRVPQGTPVGATRDAKYYWNATGLPNQPSTTPNPNVHLNLALQAGQSAPAAGTAPSIVDLPAIAIGDAEENVSIDNPSKFVNAFKFDDYVSDSDATITALKWSFDSMALTASEASTTTSTATQNRRKLSDRLIKIYELALTLGFHYSPESTTGTLLANLGGEVDVNLTVIDESPETLASLARAGFKYDPKAKREPNNGHPVIAGKAPIKELLLLEANAALISADLDSKWLRSVSGRRPVKAHR
ncbi:MAG: VIT and VWA domain-containing protein [Candidatus Sumerlaeaceae bacterium]|nr:VIT and VWA domain-containing protein [Candidatus Sumerlaeaceae bacterium]